MDEAIKMLDSKKKNVPTLYYREIFKMRAINENSLTRVSVYLYVHMYVLKQICVILIFKVRKYNIF